MAGTPATGGFSGVGGSTATAGDAGANGEGGEAASTMGGGNSSATGGASSTAGSGSSGASSSGTGDGGDGGTGASSSGTAGSGGSGPSCSAECSGDSQCVDGECVCDAALSYCDGECVDTQTDRKHCGNDCGVACNGGRNCIDGMCACAPGHQFCSGWCTDTSNSAAHCGGCDKPCNSPRSCAAGTCNCPSGQTFCSTACVDVTSDPLNCGECGAGCTGAEECENGDCRICSTGCAVLTTNVTDRTSSPVADFNINLSPPVDLGGATVTVRLYVASSSRPAEVTIHLDDTNDDSSTGTYRSMTVPGSGWFEVDISPPSDAETLRNANLIGIMISDFSANATVVVYVDSIVVSGAGVGPWQFASSGSPLTYEPNPSSDPSDISGSVSWRGL